MTSIERTAYPPFKRLITTHELHPFFSPTRDELQWAPDATNCDEHLPALLLMLKSYQRMGCSPKLEDARSGGWPPAAFRSPTTGCTRKHPGEPLLTCVTC
ncbi:hypothetical protein [Streptomyces avermitilis]|uniref:hypothetical protein n=1 Tax=Streptomyces avermitilis TaxID=33903 RepID=UPI00380D32CD